jgi:hypothetical protein
VDFELVDGDYERSLKVRNHMRASDAINPRIRIAKAVRRMGALKESENTDGEKVSMTPALTPVSRIEAANLRMNWLEAVS